MRICIDIRSTLKRKTGIGYYTLNLIKSLAAIDTKNQYILYSSMRPLSRGKKLPALPAANFRHKVDRLGLSPPAMLKGVNIFHTSSFDLKPPKGARFILTVHDIIPRVFPAGHGKDAIERFNSRLPAMIGMADVIIADSRCTAGDMVKYYPESSGKLRVVYPGACGDIGVLPKGPKNLYKPVFLRYNIRSNYILCVGTLEPRKNVNGLIRAYKILKDRGIKRQLVFAGMKGWLYEEAFCLIRELGLADNVVFTGYVPGADLEVLYNFADIAVYPSFYEGAGLPVLEAFKCGCPVVTSNASCLPEFAGDAAVLIDPYSAESIAEGIRSVLEDEALRERLRRKGLERAAQFSWERTARQVMEIFKEVSA